MNKLVQRKSLEQISKADLIFDIINYSLMFLVLVIILYPLLYIVSASFSEPMRVASGEMWLFPKGFTLEGYERLFSYSEIWLGYANTIFYTLVGTTLNLAVTLPCAYAISRKDFVGRKIIIIMLMITMFFSGGLIPTYLIVKRLNLLNTRAILIIGGATSAYNIFIARTFFSTTIPHELEEASRFDGCRNWKLFVKIILPLSIPIIAVLGLFFGVGHWNSYFNAMIYLKNRSLYPLQLILREILIMSSTENLMTNVENLDMMPLDVIIRYATVVVATVPILLVYPFLQKYFVKGIMIGAIKG